MPLRQAKYLKFPPARFARRHGFSRISLRILPLRPAKYPKLSPARFARRRGFTTGFLRILPLRQAKCLKFSPARFARRHGFTKDSLRDLPLRQAKYLKLSPARFARRHAFTKVFLRICLCGKPNTSNPPLALKPYAVLADFFQIRLKDPDGLDPLPPLCLSLKPFRRFLSNPA